MNALRRSFGCLVAASSIGVLAPSPVEALDLKPPTCVDWQGGKIGPEDFSITDMQIRVGAAVDGQFGDETCLAVAKTLVDLGLAKTPEGTFTIGKRSLEALGVEEAKPQENREEPAPAQNQPCPTSVKSMSGVSAPCKDQALQTLQDLGFDSGVTSLDIGGFQAALGIAKPGTSGFKNLGPKTYSALMQGNAEQQILNRFDIENGVIVDLSDQVLVYVVNGDLAVAGLISSGRAGRETRQGTFTLATYRKDWKDGWVASSLQRPEDRSKNPVLYLPVGFSASSTGMQAVHGTPESNYSLLGTPASSGCVRTTTGTQDRLVLLGFIGDPITVRK